MHAAAVLLQLHVAAVLLQLHVAVNLIQLHSAVDLIQLHAAVVLLQLHVAIVLIQLYINQCKPIIVSCYISYFTNCLFSVLLDQHLSSAQHLGISSFLCFSATFFTSKYEKLKKPVKPEKKHILKSE